VTAVRSVVYRIYVITAAQVRIEYTKEERIFLRRACTFVLTRITKRSFANSRRSFPTDALPTRSRILAVWKMHRVVAAPFHCRQQREHVLCSTGLRIESTAGESKSESPRSARRVACESNIIWSKSTKTL